jgi:hypothetical protein
MQLKCYLSLSALCCVSLFIIRGACFCVRLHASVVLPYCGASQLLALWHQAGWSLLDWTDPTSPQLVLSDTPPQLGNSSSWYLCDCEVFKLLLDLLKRYGIRYLLGLYVDQPKLLKESLPLTLREYFCKAIGNHVC